jgi:ABC-type protease/lipase transport system fused ATPase/permease subunit
LKQLGTTFVVMTHRTSVLGVADKMLIMRDGAQQAFGPRDEVGGLGSQRLLLPQKKTPSTLCCLNIILEKSEHENS